MEIRLADAIESLREDLRAALAKSQPDLVLHLSEIELELGVTFERSAEAGGGVKAYVFDFSAKAKGTETNVHRVKVKLAATDAEGKPLKLSSDKLPSDIP